MSAKYAKVKIFSSFATAVALAILTTLIIPIYVSNSQAIKNNFDDLSSDIRNTSYEQQFLLKDCLAKQNPNIIREDVKDLGSALGILLNHHESMGQLVSMKTYCAIHSFTSWVNTIVLSQRSCPLMLKGTYASLTEKRDVLLRNVQEDQSKYKGAFRSVKAFITLPDENKYSPDSCFGQ